MTKKEVESLIGERNWGKFLKWMVGQTMGVSDDGSMDYYSNDVRAFKDVLDGKKDRQEGPNWD